MEAEEIKQISNLFNQAFSDVWEKNLEPTLTTIQNQMVTKAYLDDKLADLSGDLVTKLKKEDEKVNRLLDILRMKNVLSDSDIKELSNLMVFPKKQL
jgi:hypothetical protein